MMILRIFHYWHCLEESTKYTFIRYISPHIQILLTLVNVLGRAGAGDALLTGVAGFVARGVSRTVAGGAGVGRDGGAVFFVMTGFNLILVGSDLLVMLLLLLFVSSIPPKSSFLLWS